MVSDIQFEVLKWNSVECEFRTSVDVGTPIYLSSKGQVSKTEVSQPGFNNVSDFQIFDSTNVKRRSPVSCNTPEVQEANIQINLQEEL